MTKVTKEEIEKLRAAIAKDEEQAHLAEQNAAALKLLQDGETALKGQLEEVQKDIVEKASLTFDVSSPMALQAARDTLKVLEERYARGE